MRTHQGGPMGKFSAIIMMILGLFLIAISMVPLYFYFLAFIEAIWAGGLDKYSIDLSREYNGVILFSSISILCFGFICVVFGLKKARFFRRKD